MPLLEEEIKQKRMNELKKRMLKQQAEQEKRTEAETQIQTILKNVLTEEARTRLNNVKLVNEELYYKAVQTIITFAQSQRITEKISDAQAKQLLEKLNNIGKKEIRIKRKGTKEWSLSEGIGKERGEENEQ